MQCELWRIQRGGGGVKHPPPPLLSNEVLRTVNLEMFSMTLLKELRRFFMQYLSHPRSPYPPVVSKKIGEPQ